LYEEKADALEENKGRGFIEKELTFSNVSSMASSLNFSLPPLLRMWSQNVARSSVLERPATPLLQKISKVSSKA